MELDEKFFHWAWRTKKRFQQTKDSQQCVELINYKDKLSTIASAFFEQSTLIKAAEENGGYIGKSLFLPIKIDLFSREELNYQVYLYRILLDSVSFQKGFYFKFSKLSRDDFKLLALIAFPTLLKNGVNEYSQLNTLKESFQKELSISNIKKLNFFDLWQAALIDRSVLEEKNINKVYKDLIRSYLKTDNLTPSSLIELGKVVKKELKLLGLSIDHQTTISIFIPNLATSAQRISVTEDINSKITSGDSDEVTLMKTKSKERVNKIDLDEKDPDCNPASLLMEGVKTADLFSGGKKMVDGSDELMDHFEAIEELDMREISRSSKQTQSIFKAEISVDVEYVENEEDEKQRIDFYYDEWDVNKKKYRSDWCSIKENKLEAIKPDPLNPNPNDFNKYLDDTKIKHHKEIKKLKKKLDQVLLQRRPKNRQIDGPEIDIDALINCKADIQSGHTPTNKLYISKRKAPSDVSILLLIDSSLSSDSWVDGKKVMDITKESIIVIQEVLDGLFEDIMIASFFSNTRKNCAFNIVKDFDEKWSKCAPRLESVTPTGYTRIGVALRHCFHKFSKVKAKKKVVLLLSDGKPTDYDVYEGKYGIGDVRQCVREAQAQDINIFSLAIDKDAKFYFPQLFGKSNYEILSGPEQLSEQLMKLFSKII
jgi:nitric oxide reductase NorD protein